MTDPIPGPPAGQPGTGSQAGARAAAFLRMPGHLLRRCHQISVGIFLDECRHFDLTPLQYAALSSLASAGPLDQAALGRHAALDRTTASLVLRKLAARGLVEPAPSGRDRRSKAVGITADGCALLARISDSVDTVQQRILAPLRDNEQRMLLRLLEKLAEENNTHSRAPLRRR